MADTRAFSRRFDAVTRWAAFLGFLLLLIVAAATVVDVLMRWLFQSPIEGLDDISHLAFAIIIVACFPAGLLQGHNITIRFLGKAVGDRGGYWLEVLGAALTLFFFAMIAWQLVVHTGQAHSSGDTTMTVEAITWPWWLGATAIVILCVPVQIAVLTGHWQRAATGREPGGTIEGERVEHDV